MLTNTIAVFGAGGHTYSLLNILELNAYKIIGIYDDNFNTTKEEYINAYKILGGAKDIPSDCQIVISKGDNQERERFFSYFGQQISPDNLVHPSARIEKSVLIKGSNQIFAGVYINSGANIGQDNILNTYSIIEHGAVIGSHNHIAIGAKLCGKAVVGNFCFIGAGAVIIDKVSVGNNVIIGANAVVTEDIDQPGTFVGVPARRIK